MTMARYDLTVTDSDGNVVPGAAVYVRAEVPGAPLAALKSDRAGSVGEDNPVTTDAKGRAGFYVVGGFYKITVIIGAMSDERRYVPIGLAQGSDIAASGHSEREVTAAGAVVVTSDDADIILINKSVGAATAVTIPNPETTSKSVRIVDRKYDAATNNITISSDGVGKTIMGGAQYVIDSNGGSILLTPLEDGTGWI